MNYYELTACSKFRTKNRMPALTYYYKKNGCSIWRCSQPKNGFLEQSIED
jgi:hypothetical protein